jgi:hypothetical protein
MANAGTRTPSPTTVEEWDRAWGDKLKNNNKANKSLMRIIF